MSEGGPNDAVPDRVTILEGVLTMLLAVRAETDPGADREAVGSARILALTWLQRLSAVATGAVPPEPGAALDDYAARLSRPGAVGEADASFPPSFRPWFRMETVD
jgi:hypothetical protein